MKSRGSNYQGGVCVIRIGSGCGEVIGDEERNRVGRGGWREHTRSHNGCQAAIASERLFEEVMSSLFIASPLQWER